MGWLDMVGYVGPLLTTLDVAAVAIPCQYCQPYPFPLGPVQPGIALASCIPGNLSLSEVGTVKVSAHQEPCPVQVAACSDTRYSATLVRCPCARGSDAGSVDTWAVGRSPPYHGMSPVGIVDGRPDEALAAPVAVLRSTWRAVCC